MKRVAFALLSFTALGAILIVPQATAGIAASASPSNSAAATVQISNFQFSPKLLTVRRGTIVTWSNNEGTPTVTADNGAFASDNLTPGKSFSFKFTRPGTYRYHCTFHGSKGGGEMAGVVKVTR